MITVNGILATYSNSWALMRVCTTRKAYIPKNISWRPPKPTHVSPTLFLPLTLTLNMLSTAPGTGGGCATYIPSNGRNAKNEPTEPKYPSKSH